MSVPVLTGGWPCFLKVVESETVPVTSLSDKHYCSAPQTVHEKLGVEGRTVAGSSSLSASSSLTALHSLGDHVSQMNQQLKS